MVWEKIKTYKIESKDTKYNIVKSVVYKFKKNNIITYNIGHKRKKKVCISNNGIERKSVTTDSVEKENY